MELPQLRQRMKSGVALRSSLATLRSSLAILRSRFAAGQLVGDGRRVALRRCVGRGNRLVGCRRKCFGSRPRLRWCCRRSRRGWGIIGIVSARRCRDETEHEASRPDLNPPIEPHHVIPPRIPKVHARPHRNPSKVRGAPALRARQSSSWRSCPVIELIGTVTTDIFVFFVRSGKFRSVCPAGKVGSAANDEN